MDNKIEIFKNNEFGAVRILVINNEPWFVGKDVAEILGYTKARNAIAAHVDIEDKKGAPIRGDLGGTQEMIIVNESGLYSLILASKLPSAKKFKKWVTSEVLPSIRKTGSYFMPDFSNPAEAARAWANEYEAKQKALAQIEEQKTKVLFADAVSASKTSILIGDLAKLLKQNKVEIGQKRLFAWLRDNNYLMKHGSSKNMPTQKAMEQGLFEIKEGSYVNSDGVNVTTRTTKVTGKGQVFFVNRFLEA